MTDVPSMSITRPPKELESLIPFLDLGELAGLSWSIALSTSEDVPKVLGEIAARPSSETSGSKWLENLQ